MHTCKHAHANTHAHIPYLILTHTHTHTYTIPFHFPRMRKISAWAKAANSPHDGRAATLVGADMPRSGRGCGNLGKRREGKHARRRSLYTSTGSPPQVVEHAEAAPAIFPTCWAGGARDEIFFRHALTVLVKRIQPPSAVRGEGPLALCAKDLVALKFAGRGSEGVPTHAVSHLSGEAPPRVTKQA